MNDAPLSSSASAISSRPWLGWLSLSVAIAVAAGVAVIIDRLRERADVSRLVQVELASLDASAHELAALEWETIHKESLDEERSGHLEKIRTEITERFSHLGVLGANLPQLEEFANDYRAYLLLVEQEFKLIAAAKIKEAEEFDATKVDPAFEKLETALAEAGDAYAKVALRALGQIRIGALLVLLSGVGSIGGLIWLFNHKQRLVAVAAAEQRLRDQHALILNSVGEGMHGLDLDGRITFENPASAAMLGYELLELTGRPAHSAMHHTRPDGTLYPPGECPIYATLKDGRVRKIKDEVFWRKDGTSFPVEYTSTAQCDEQGRIIGATVVFTDVTWRKQLEAQMAETHQQLLATTRQAGMAEVATSVLHNVGNVLNSVNVSATLVADHVRHTEAGKIAKVAGLFDQHKSDLAEFLTQDHRGQMIPGYLNTLAASLAAEQTTIITELEHLRKNVDHIKDIVAMQQSYAQSSRVIEPVSVPDMIEDALRIDADALARHGVEAIRDYQVRPVVTTDRHQVMQILINLVRNAKLACLESGRPDKQITVRTTSTDHSVQIAIIDNGIGIPAENLTRIFNHGFTTRKDGHGFALHSGALAARELGGSLTVQSDGPGHGATFTLELPVRARTLSP